DLFELVNMNGRIYDPVIGRFLSADPYSQMPEHTQGLNRYSYCMNNPLSFTDPSGYSMSDAGFASFIGMMAAIVVTAAVTVASYGTAAPLMVAVLAGAAAMFSGAVVGALMSGANFSQALGAGMMEGTKGAFISAATYGIGSMWANSAKFVHLAIRSIGHAVFNGGMRLIQGGRFEHGFFSGFFSSMGMGGMSNILGNNTLAYGIIGAAIGGTAESLGGGKFANGAVTGAFVGLFNHGMHLEEEAFNEEQLKKMYGVYRKSVKDFRDPADFYESIGGPLGDWAAKSPNEFQNTCAARLSKALNYSGFEIPEGTPATYLGGDGKYYFINAKAMSKYLSGAKVWGQPAKAGTGSQITNAVIFQTGFSGGVTGHLDVIYQGEAASGHAYKTTTFYWN
ncbi:MAG: hypothetical protein CO098_10705, partial [Bacteroidetes bacterium CG_4_9_14_3_um_filter_41_19]